MQAGEIHLHRQFYIDRDTGEFRGKYFLILAVLPSGDFVARLLTSRQYDRPKTPPCFHGDPYPAFYLDSLGGPLRKESWLDLRHLEDLDERDLSRDTANGVCGYVMTLVPASFRAAAECAAGAADTSRLQARAIRDGISSIGP